MNSPTSPPTRFAAALATAIAVALSLSLTAVGALAHDFHIKRIVVDHPYADPAPGGAAESRVYLRAIKNRGTKPDRLLEVTSPVADQVEIRHLGKGAERASAAAALDLPVDSVTRLRPEDEWQLVLLRPRRALSPGETFKLRLRFQVAGDAEIPVEVRKLKPHAASSAEGH